MIEYFESRAFKSSLQGFPKRVEGALAETSLKVIH
jgi:hypothetical protein